MKIGTKSVLFGYHCFAIHPWFVAWAWWQLYGFPWDPRLWVAFFTHDLGYIGKPNMDGPEGESHPELGRKIMQRLFGQQWGDFTLLHSRFVARSYGVPWSRLCIADKLATALTPRWLFLFLANASGEIHEYMCERPVGNSQRVESTMFTRGLCEGLTPEKWHHNMTTFVLKWAWDNREVDPAPDLRSLPPITN